MQIYSIKRYTRYTQSISYKHTQNTQYTQSRSHTAYTQTLIHSQYTIIHTNIHRHKISRQGNSSPNRLADHFVHIYIPPTALYTTSWHRETRTTNTHYSSPVTGKPTIDSKSLPPLPPPISHADLTRLNPPHIPKHSTKPIQTDPYKSASRLASRTAYTAPRAVGYDLTSSQHSPSLLLNTPDPPSTTPTSSLP